MVKKMMDLVEIEVKKSKKKIIIISIVATLVADLFLVLGFIFINQSQSVSKQKEEKLLAKEKQEHIIREKNKIIYNDSVKQKIKKIYNYDGKRVFLTFDDGPSKSVTPFILDLLKQENIKATFFTLGSRVELYPEIVKRAYEEGHYIANHGYSHVYKQIYCSAQTVLEEYQKTEQAIQQALGNTEFHSHLFRFPGGSKGGKYDAIKQEAISLLDANQVTYVDWNALTADSAGMKTKEEMLEYVKSTIGNKKSVVILMHDAGDKILTYEMLPELIKYLKEQGYEFQNIYDIMNEVE